MNCEQSSIRRVILIDIPHCPDSGLMTGLLLKVTRWMAHVEQELLTIRSNSLWV